MDHPFFMNKWAAPLRHRYHPQPTAPSPSPKVVSIPVQFVGPMADHRRPLDPSAAAVRIQKASRGFLVRKNMSTVRKIAGEAEEIARRIEISAEEIRRDDRERLRVGEMLMALLLKLDSVRGVRDYRKTVIRRVIQLQETVDSITTNTNNAAAEEATESEEAMMEESKVNGAGVDSMDEVPDCAWPEKEEEAAAMEEAEAEPEEKPEEKPVELTEDGPQGLELSLEKLVGLQEVMERTVAESEQMKGLVSVLCERSAQQCRLMNGLVQRVEQLERRVQSMERKKKKKKRQAANHSNALNKKE